MNGVTIVTVNHLVKIVFQVSFTIWSNFPKCFQIDGDFKHGNQAACTYGDHVKND